MITRVNGKKQTDEIISYNFYRTITCDEESSNLVSTSHPVHTYPTLNSFRESRMPPQGHGYILQLVMKTLHGKSSELPTTPYLSFHLKYTINMLRRRPEYRALRQHLSLRFLLFLPPFILANFFNPFLDEEYANGETEADSCAFHFYRGAR